MNQILFISNKKIYKELYQINTSIYLNADLLYLTSKNAAQLNAEQLNLVKIIIFECDQYEILQELSMKILNNRNEKLPLICFNDGIDIPGAFTLTKLEDPLNLKEVLKSCALAFGVTAQDMSNLNVPDYFPVIRKVFKYLKESPVKIYIKDESNQFQQLWDVNQEISGEQYFQYAATKSFYVLKNDRLKLANAVNPKLIEFAKQRTHAIDSSDVKMIEKTIQEISNHFTKDLKVTEEIIQISEDCISEIDHCIEQVSNFDHLFKLLKENINHYINVHGILACYIAKNIMESLDWATHEHIEKLTYSFFFQDITLVPLFIESESLQSETDLFVDLNQPRNIKDVLLYHAQKAAEIVRDFPNLPIGIDSVIIQHHGSPTGFGIAPDPQDNISPIAKVSIIAERFVEEAYPHLMDESFNQEVKLQIVSKLKEKFSKKSYQKLVDLIAELPF